MSLTDISEKSPTSEGKPLCKYQDRLAKEQRKLSEMALKAKAAGRSLKDSRNYQKQKRKVAKVHEKIANCRKDALHKLSRQLADQYDAIASKTST